MTRVNWPMVSALLVDAGCWTALIRIVAVVLRWDVHS